MPKNWKTYKLSDALEIKYGKDHKKVQDGNIPIYGTGGIMRYGNQGLYDKETILIPRKGSLNNIYYLNEPFWSVDTIFWSKINEDVAFPKYLFYNLKVLDFASMDVGSAIPSLTTELLKKIEIDLPSLPEQKSIAQILSTIDDKIENNLAINKTLEEMAMALYKHWFVDFGPFQNGEFVASELGSIPKGWEVKKITDLIEVKDGTHDSPKRVEDGFYLITSKHIGTNTIDFSSAYKISNDDFIKINKRSLVEKGDILMTMIGTVGNFYFVNEEPNYVIKNLGLFKTSKTPLIKIYLFSFFKSKIGQEYIKAQMTGSTQQYVTLKTLRNIDILVPNDQILTDYNHLANEYYEQILINIKENQTLTQLRDTLLPKLISGEVLLKEFREAIKN